MPSCTLIVHLTSILIFHTYKIKFLFLSSMFTKINHCHIQHLWPQNYLNILLTLILHLIYYSKHPNCQLYQDSIRQPSFLCPCAALLWQVSDLIISAIWCYLTCRCFTVPHLYYRSYTILCSCFIVSLHMYFTYIHIYHNIFHLLILVSWHMLIGPLWSHDWGSCRIDIEACDHHDARLASLNPFLQNLCLLLQSF